MHLDKNMRLCSSARVSRCDASRSSKTNYLDLGLRYTLGARYKF